MPVRTAARKYKVPPQTLRDRVNGKVDADNLKNKETLFSFEEEQSFVEHIVTMDRLGHGMTNIKIKALAGELAYILGKKPSDRPLSNSWIYAFLGRWRNFVDGNGIPIKEQTKHETCTSRDDQGNSLVPINVSSEETVLIPGDSVGAKIVGTEERTRNIISGADLIHHVDTNKDITHQESCVVNEIEIESENVLTRPFYEADIVTEFFDKRLATIMLKSDGSSSSFRPPFRYPKQMSRKRKSMDFLGEFGTIQGGTVKQKKERIVKTLVSRKTPTESISITLTRRPITNKQKISGVDIIAVENDSSGYEDESDCEEDDDNVGERTDFSDDAGNDDDDNDEEEDDDDEDGGDIDSDNDYSSNNGDDKDGSEVCCVCKQFFPPNLESRPYLKMVSWAYCDNCDHCVHLSFCHKKHVIRKKDSFMCPCCTT